MSQITMRPVGLAVAALVVVVTGVILTGSGRPFSSTLLNLHKLVDLAAVVALGASVYRTAESASLSNLEWAGIALAGILVIGTFATGGMVSARESSPAWVVWGHRVGSWIAVSAAAWCGWLVLR